LNSNSAVKKNLIFADGGTKLGFGHLMRALNLSKILKIQSSSIFIFETLEQKNFYKTHKVICMQKNALPLMQYQLLIIDSKVNKTALILELQDLVTKTLVIDNLVLPSHLYNFMALPSFFENAIDRNFPLAYREKILLGPEYLILNPKIFDVKNNQRKEFIAISFGGSDPNNLTLFVLSLLKEHMSLVNVLVILGPGYKHDRSLIEKIINKKQILDNPLNLFEVFAKSFIVITAFGVTLQELFYLDIPAGIIANYQNDFDDFLRIENYYYNTKQKNPFYFFGTMQKINHDKVFEAIKSSMKAKQNFQLNKAYGSGWEGLRNKLLS
jgi:UDP-2,4-diacetamido-2,4,6-trideoxy-beta-L-altropyranose hydrolase